MRVCVFRFFLLIFILNVNIEQKKNYGIFFVNKYTHAHKSKCENI